MFSLFFLIYEGVIAKKNEKKSAIGVVYTSGVSFWIYRKTCVNVNSGSPPPNKSFQRGVESPSYQTILENLYKHWRHPHITCYNKLTIKIPPVTSGIYSYISISHTPLPALFPSIHIFKIKISSVSFLVTIWLLRQNWTTVILEKERSCGTAIFVLI